MGRDSPSEVVIPLMTLKGGVRDSETAEAGHHMSVLRCGDRWVSVSDCKIEFVPESAVMHRWEPGELGCGALLQHGVPRVRVELSCE